MGESGSTIGRPPILDLADPRATDHLLAGNKAAALARAAAAGLPVLPGFVLTTAVHLGAVPEPSHWSESGLGREIRARWEQLSHRGELALVVRSSSTIEDVASSSMAGRFRSVTSVFGWSRFVRAVTEVRDSAEEVVPDGRVPMGVLVQPQLQAVCGGVMFSVDPVTGDTRRIVVETVSGTPDALVSGRVTASRLVLSRRGRALEVDEDAAVELDRRQRRTLARLARRADAAFGGPQDIEWAFDDRGRLWLLQSRPITATGRTASATGPHFGPGPVAETFPEPLRRLEVELWLEPLRAGIIRALRVIGVVSRRRVAASPVVIEVGGRVAADLELFGIAPERRSLWRFVDPIPPARRLRAAWRIGRLRRGLPRMASELLRRTDAQLAVVPPLDALSDRELLWLVQRVRRTLVSVHGYEVLAGMLLARGEQERTAAGVALSRIREARGLGWAEARIVGRLPVVLALTNPRIGSPAALPSVRESGSDLEDRVAPVEGPLPLREDLRLRARWLEELLARAATVLGRRSALAGRLPAAAAIRDLSLRELTSLVGGDRPPADLGERMRKADGPPLPSVFRLTLDGDVAPAHLPRGPVQGGRGAGGGRGMGRVHQLAEGPIDEDGEVLVVRVLEPGLAAALPHLGGLVAETGSTLSHLAILAREVRVPTVVGVEDALERYPPGTLVSVDGTTGEVKPIQAEAAR